MKIKKQNAHKITQFFIKIYIQKYIYKNLFVLK